MNVKFHTITSSLLLGTRMKTRKEENNNNDWKTKFKNQHKKHNDQQNNNKETEIGRKTIVWKSHTRRPGHDQESEILREKLNIF